MNEQVEESITLSEEKWLWFNFDKHMLEKRSLLPESEEQTSFIRIGPIMSGDSSKLLKSTNSLKVSFEYVGLTRFIFQKTHMLLCV